MIISIFIEGHETPMLKIDAEKVLYRNQPVLFSILRNDGRRACSKWPWCCCLPCLWCVCLPCCQDGAKIYSGGMDDPEGKERGRAYNANPDNLIGSIIQVLIYSFIYIFTFLNIFLYFQRLLYSFKNNYLLY